jgi:hypothetical protein
MRWSNTLLNAKWQTADPLADEAVARLVQARMLPASRQLTKAMARYFDTCKNRRFTRPAEFEQAWDLHSE